MKCQEIGRVVAMYWSIFTLSTVILFVNEKCVCVYYVSCKKVQLLFMSNHR